MGYFILSQKHDNCQEATRKNKKNLGFLITIFFQEYRFLLTMNRLISTIGTTVLLSNNKFMFVSTYLGHSISVMENWLYIYKFVRNTQCPSPTHVWPVFFNYLRPITWFIGYKSILVYMKRDIKMCLQGRVYAKLRV